MLGRFRAVEVDQIYAYELLHRFVLSMIGIFIPIYIASNGMQINWVFNYILVATAAFAAACIPASYAIANIGFKHSLILSYFFYMPAFISLRTFSLSPTLIVSAEWPTDLEMHSTGYLSTQSSQQTQNRKAEERPQAN